MCGLLFDVCCALLLVDRGWRFAVRLLLVGCCLCDVYRVLAVVGCVLVVCVWRLLSAVCCLWRVALFVVCC